MYENRIRNTHEVCVCVCLYVYVRACVCVYLLELLCSGALPPNPRFGVFYASMRECVRACPLKQAQPTAIAPHYENELTVIAATACNCFSSASGSIKCPPTAESGEQERPSNSLHRWAECAVG